MLFRSDEIYIVYSGQLTVTVDDEQEVVEAGDVIAIPPNLMHTMTALSEEAVWAALWWEHI